MLQNAGSAPDPVAPTHCSYIHQSDIHAIHTAAHAAAKKTTADLSTSLECLWLQCRRVHNKVAESCHFDVRVYLYMSHLLNRYLTYIIVLYKLLSSKIMTFSFALGNYIEVLYFNVGDINTCLFIDFFFWCV